MDSEQPAALVPSTSTSISKPPKASHEASVSSSCGTHPPKEGKDAGKFSKGKQPRKKPTKSLPQVMRPDPHLKDSVKKLHDRTRHVKIKLTKIKETMGSRPNSPAINNKIKQIKEKEPTEEDLLLEIERLKGLVQEMRLKASAEKDESKLPEGTKSHAVNDAKPVVIDNDKVNVDNEKEYSKDLETVETDAKLEEKVKRRRARAKNKKKIPDEVQLRNEFEKHINRIIIGANVEKAKFTELRYRYGDDLEKFAQKCVEAGLGRIVEAEVRVNAKNNHQAFLSLGPGPDAMMSSMKARKYAMEGDIVRAFVRNPPEVSKVPESGDGVDPVEQQPTEAVEPHQEDHPMEFIDDEEILEETEPIDKSTRQAFAIRILRELGSRVFVGAISFKNPSKLDCGEFFKFKPRDMKVPILLIPVESCEEMANKQKPEDVLGFLYVAEIVEIKENGEYIGTLQTNVGKCGNLEAEIRAILLNNGLKDVKPFEERFEQMWTSPLEITEPDELDRDDLRHECIFTIDPLTARDLDDAVSCKTLENGYYEIGVHISDVTHFLGEFSELDELVKTRSTSIYLVNEVIHMLPKSLCMKCSLLPGEDKFAFSVFWVMNNKAKVISTRYSKSIIRSCTQFAYEHAQKIIDNPNEPFTADDFPDVCNGFTVHEIVDRVLKLNSLAQIMRAKRFENGSLSIDKPQFYFQLDPKTGEPISYEIDARDSANFLIEEFMLLANQSVAQYIYRSFPDISFLRSHQPPKPSAIRNLRTKLSTLGIELDMSSSKTISNGLQEICGKSGCPKLMSAAMNYLLTKPMMRAKYFCSESVTTEFDLYHYALAVPIYTHFTSPIRRYPDILVHRLLSAALDYTTVPKRSPTELHELAKVCNDQKFNAKNAGEESSNLYFQRYIKAKKCIELKGVIIEIYRHSMEVIILETGHLIGIQFKLQKVVVDASKAPASVFISEKNSLKPPLELKMFSAVDVKLMLWEGRLTGFFVTPDKDQRMKNAIIASLGHRAESSVSLVSDVVAPSSVTPKKNRRNAAKKSKSGVKKSESEK